MLLLYAAAKQEEQRREGKREIERNKKIGGAKLNRICKKGSSYNAMGSSYCAHCLISPALLVSHSITRSCNLVSSGSITFTFLKPKASDFSTRFHF
jgi:hypothetical protein